MRVQFVRDRVWRSHTITHPAVGSHFISQIFYSCFVFFRLMLLQHLDNPTKVTEDDQKIIRSSNVHYDLLPLNIHTRKSKRIRSETKKNRELSKFVWAMLQTSVKIVWQLGGKIFFASLFERNYGCSNIYIYSFRRLEILTRCKTLYNLYYSPWRKQLLYAKETVHLQRFQMPICRD